MKTRIGRISAALLLLATLLALLLPAVSLFQGDSAVYNRVIRLHVLANSDRAEDQALKLKVRDAIVRRTAEILAGCGSAEEAEERLAGAKEHIAAFAEEALRAEGSKQGVEVMLCREQYPTKEYSGFRLPQGTYTSLRVLIGEGAGHNWWCVLYPSLCLSASLGEAEDAFLAVGFSPDQIRVLTDTDRKQYVVRFRILEWFGRLFG